MKYTTPEIEIVRFEAMEVMAASTGNEDLAPDDVVQDPDL